MNEVRNKREAAFKRWGQLETERSSWLTHWQDLQKYFLPRSGRFFQSVAPGAPNRGDKRHQHIYDNTAIRSLGVMAAGLMAGMTSPARPWFRLKTPDEKLNENQNVKRWLHAVEQKMRDIYNQGNTYRAFRQIYEELGCFGTAPNIVLPNYDRVIHNYPLTAGEYAIDTDEFGQVNTLYRNFDMNVGQLVQKFGYKNCSLHVRNLYDNGTLSAWQNVLHVIEPRRDRDPMKLGAANLPWSSCYYERTAQEDESLRMSGYRDFPAVVPRWTTRAADVYGSSPGMIALGDTKQLQHQQLRKSQAIDFMTMPPLQAPTASKGKISLRPGKVSYTDVASAGVKSMFEVNLDLSALREDIMDVRYRIKQAFFEDLFLMITNMQGVQPRNVEEIVERKEEKLLMLGPVLESLHDEMLGPYIEMTFVHGLEAGIFPPPPRELQGQPLVIKFVSLLAQAQQLVGLGAVERFVGTIVNVSAVKPDILDKVDTDQVVDVYADILGIDPHLVVADKNVVLIRQQRQQQQQAMMAAEMAPKVAGAMKDVDSLQTNSQEAAVAALDTL